MLDIKSNQRSQFTTKNWVETYDESRGTYNTNIQIKFKTTTLKSTLCNYNNAYKLVKGTITVSNAEAADDLPAVNNNGDIVQFNGTNVTDSFNFKAKVTGQTMVR